MLILKLIWKYRLRVAKTILQKNKFKDLRLFNFIIYSNATSIKKMCSRFKLKKYNQCH